MESTLTPNQLTKILQTHVQKNLFLSIMLWGAPGIPGASDGMATRQDAADLEAHWRVARNQATLVAKMQKSGKGQGWGSGNWNREYAVVEESILDWRQYLWRFIVRTPTDFTGFDRCFIGEGLYLDGFSGDTVSVIICIDTSGSISDHELGQFRAEVLSILRCYPHIQAELFYADTELHGPYPLTLNNEWPTPVGGGGTDFCPFFDYLVENAASMLQQRAVVYLNRWVCRFSWLSTQGSGLVGGHCGWFGR